MASKSQAGRGTKFSIAGLTGGAPVTPPIHIGEVNMTTVSGLNFDLEDVSNFDSGYIKEKLGTMADGGTVEIKYNYISGGTDAGQVAIEAAAKTGDPYDFTILLPKNARVGQTTTGDSLAFSAIVTKAGGRDISVKGVITSSVSLAVVSEIVPTFGS